MTLATSSSFGLSRHSEFEPQDRRARQRRKGRKRRRAGAGERSRKVSLENLSLNYSRSENSSANSAPATGGMVSAAICRGPGNADLPLLSGAAGMAPAATEGATAVAAAAPTRPAPFRKLRRLESAPWFASWRRFGMNILPRTAGGSA